MGLSKSTRYLETIEGGRKTYRGPPGLVHPFLPVPGPVVSEYSLSSSVVPAFFRYLNNLRLWIVLCRKRPQKGRSNENRKYHTV